jgi:hypothetical protein
VVIAAMTAVVLWQGTDRKWCQKSGDSADGAAESADRTIAAQKRAALGAAKKAKYQGEIASSTNQLFYE